MYNTYIISTELLVLFHPENMEARFVSFMLCEIEQFVYIVSISTIFAWIFIEFGSLVPRTLEILIFLNLFTKNFILHLATTPIVAY